MTLAVRVFTFLAFWLNFLIKVSAQETHNFAQFYFNPSALNPSFTGIDGQKSLFLAYKKQWVGIQGAPVVSNFSFQVPSPKRIAFGLNANQDSRGVLNTSSFSFASSYNLPINRDAFFRFGLAVGASWNRTNIDALRFASTTNDQVLSGLIQNQAQIIGSAGASIHSKTFHVGFSLPYLFQPVYLASQPFEIAPFKPFGQSIIHASYRLYLSRDQIIIEPYINYRFNISIPSQIEMAGVLHYRGLMWGGLSYKQDFGISTMAGLKISPAFAFGYAYSIKNTGINELGKPSHELQIGYLFGLQYKNAPVYSFVNTNKKRLRTRQQMLLAQKSRKPALVTNVKKGSPVARATSGGTIPKVATTPARTTPQPSSRPSGLTQNQSSPVQPRQQPVAQSPTGPVQTVNQAQNNVSPNASILNPKTTPAPDRRALTQPRLADQSAGAPPEEDDDETGEDAAVVHGVSHLEDSLQQVDETERFTRLDLHKANPLEVHVGEAQHADRFEKVQKGQNPGEINAGEYVIVGIFKDEVNAKKYTEGLRLMGFSDFNYGFQSAKNIWFVHSNSVADAEVARATRDRLRNLKIFRDAWLLTVLP